MNAGERSLGLLKKFHLFCRHLHGGRPESGLSMAGVGGCSGNRAGAHLCHRIGRFMLPPSWQAGSGPEAISYTLLGSYKNLGLAASVSLTLFGQQASLPAAFSVQAETAFFLLLNMTKPRQP